MWSKLFKRSPMGYEPPQLPPEMVVSPAANGSLLQLRISAAHAAAIAVKLMLDDYSDSPSLPDSAEYASSDRAWRPPLTAFAAPMTQLQLKCRPKMIRARCSTTRFSEKHRVSRLNSPRPARMPRKRGRKTKSSRKKNSNRARVASPMSGRSNQ